MIGRWTDEQALEAWLRLHFGRESVPAWGFSQRAHRSPNARAARRSLAELMAERAAAPSAEAQARFGPAIAVHAARLLAELEHAEAIVGGRALPPLEVPELPS